MSVHETAASWSPEELENRLEAGDDFFVFDVRNEDEFEAWRIEGWRPLEMVNVPYYEMLEIDEFDDVVDTFEDFLKKGWADKLPTEGPILTVCAKGDTSEYVAAAMRRLGLEAINLAGGTTAWGNHYSVRSVVETPGRSVIQVARPARGCLSYVVTAGREALVIDPLRHIAHYRKICSDAGVDIVAVIDTHGHADHISGGYSLASEVGVP